VKRRIARVEVLAGVMAFVVCSAPASHALADELPPVLEVAPPTPAAPPPLLVDGQPQTTLAPSPGWQPSRPFVAVVFGTVAVASAASGAVFGVLALHDKSKFESHAGLSAANSANENAVAADVCFGAALALGVTSLVLLLTGNRAVEQTAVGALGASPAPPPEKSPVSFSVSPMISLHGGGAGAALRF
jgi:hypothetical protein